MKLVTAQMEKILAKYPLYSQEEKGKEADILFKFFAPVGASTWYILEGEKQGDDYNFFGIVFNGEENEYGYFSLNELQRIRLPFGLRIERDLNFSPCKVKDLN